MNRTAVPPADLRVRARSSIAAARSSLAGDRHPVPDPRRCSRICDSCGQDLVAGFRVHFAGVAAFEVCGRCLPDLDGPFDISWAVV